MGSVARNVREAIQKLMMDELNTLSYQPEAYINYYAVFMGYLSIAIKALGYLVLTWTTVVLLGGFVSMLKMKDFLSLTVITLVQTAGVLDVTVNEKLLRNISYSFLGLLASMWPLRGSLEKEEESLEDTWQACMAYLALLAATVQALVFVLVLFPLATAYVFGLYISTGVSLWRLIQRDFVDATDTDPGKENLRPALYVLYSLVLLQGGLLCYKTVFSTKKNALADFVVRDHKFDDDARQSVLDYFHATTIGCAKDPSFVHGRNLITYALELMESRSPESYLSGTRILDTLLRHDKRGELQHNAAKRELIGSPSGADVLRKLLWTLDQASWYGEEARGRAVRIVDNLADAFHLDQFPGGMQCIVSLLHDEKLAEQGMHILTKLADDDGNRRALSNTQGLLSEVIATINSDRKCSDSEHHDTWSSIAWASLSLLLKLIDSPGECGAKLQWRQDNEAISAATMAILKCATCSYALQKKAMKIIQGRHGDEARRSLIAIMVDVFSRATKDHVRRWAEKELKSLSETNASIILQAKDDAVATLAEVITDDRNDNIAFKIPAVGILERLCSNCYITDDDECFKKLKKDMIHAMPKVLGKLYQCIYSDIEVVLLDPLLSLCWTVRDKLVGADKDSTLCLDEIAAHNCLDRGIKPAMSFPDLLKDAKEMPERFLRNNFCDDKLRLRIIDILMHRPGDEATRKFVATMLVIIAPKDNTNDASPRNPSMPLQIAAAKNLERLCNHPFTMNYASVKKLKKDMIVAMPKVIRVIKKVLVKLRASADIEPGKDDEELLQALLKLCETVRYRLIGEDQEFCPRLDKLLEAGKPAESLPAILEEAQKFLHERET